MELESGELIRARCVLSNADPKRVLEMLPAEIGDQVIDLIETYAPNLRECVVELQVLGPPDIEERIGLTGGNIFQGETLPDQMWDRRLESRTPLDGLYLCGVAAPAAG